VNNHFCYKTVLSFSEQHCTALYSTVHVHYTGARTSNKHTRPGFEVFWALFLRIPFLCYMMTVCHWVYY